MDAWVSQMKARILHVNAVVKRSSSQWAVLAATVRADVNQLNLYRIMQDNERLLDRIFFCNQVQEFAYHDHDSGGARDLGAWCEREWNRILEVRPHDVDSLKGLGQIWLLKAQFWLSRIEKDRISTSDSEEDDRREAERRNSPNYVEARAVLMPSVEFLNRAALAAEAQRRLTGDLLALKAEAGMSLGNISDPRVATAYFKDAVRTLKRANEIAGYRLPEHLKQYLTDFEHVLTLH